MAHEDKFERLKPKPVSHPEQPPLHISGKSRPKVGGQSKEGPMQKLSRTLTELQRSVAAMSRASAPPLERRTIAQAATEAIKTQERVVEKNTHTATEKHTHEHSHDSAVAERLVRDSKMFEHVRTIASNKPNDIRGAGITAPPRTGLRTDAPGAFTPGQPGIPSVGGSRRMSGSANTGPAVNGAVDSQRHTPIRVPPISPPRTHSRKHVRSGQRGSASGYQVVNGADAEAHRHIIEQSDSGVGALPSAARLAHILRADELVRDGTGEPSELISSLASAIRSGDRRAVADVDPVKVQDAINTALGGETRAQQLLNTPETTRMIERYQSTVNAVRENIHNTEKQIERASQVGITSTPRRSTSVSQQVQPARAAAAPAAGNIPRMGSNAGNPAAAVDARALETMLSTNEEPHAIAAGEAEQQEMRLTAREGAKTPRMATAPRLTSAERTDTAAPPLERGRAVGSGISVSPSAPVKLTTDPIDKQSTKKGGRMQMDGKLTIMGPGGQMLGEARLDADVRDR